jgi:glutamate-1-semialdehyde 2,1-aminomutase
VLKHAVILPWNDAEACEKILEREAANVAALIVDPLLGIGGILPPVPGFLERLREIATKHGIVLIFDEVISFRIARGGAQERFGVRPDLTTLGKIIGGGLPVGAFGGRADIMAAYDPRKGGARISHGGTFNANPLTMAAGLATMQALTPEAFARLDALGERLRGGVTRLLGATRFKGQVTGIGSLFCLHWVTGALPDYRSSRPKDPEAPMRVFLGLLNEGIILSQRGLGACSLAMGDEDVDRFVNALARVLARG